MSSKLEKLAASPETTQAQFIELIDKGYDYAAIIAKNPAAGISVLRRIYDVLKAELSAIRAASTVLCSPNIDTQFIIEMCADSPDLEPEGDVDWPEETCFPVLLAKHPKTPSDVVKKLAMSRWYMVREHIAARPDLPRESAQILARDPIAHVRQILASNPRISDQTIDLLVADEDPTTRMKVALHPNAKAPSIKKLISDPNETVRLAALCSPNGG